MEYQNITKSELACLRNIIDENPLKALDVLRECAEIAGLVSIEDYSNLMVIPKRTVQYQCQKRLIHGLEVSDKLIPCINANIQ